MRDRLSYRDQMGMLFSAEAEGFVRRSKGALIPKAALCVFYQYLVEGGSTAQELSAVRLGQIHKHLVKHAGLRHSLKRIEPALRRALYDINLAIRHRGPFDWFGIRTNGSLWLRLPYGADLDSPFPQAGAHTSVAARAAESSASYAAPEHTQDVRLEGVGDDGQVRLPRWASLRQGARVVVIASRSDVTEEPSAPRAFSRALLDAMIGAVAYGGDALVDSEAEPS